MHVWDGHCDVLAKLLERPELTFDDPGLDANRARLRSGGVRMQTFAIFLCDRKPKPTMDDALESVRLFQERILADPAFMPIRSQKDVEELSKDLLRTGAMLTLEGADVIEGRTAYLRALFDLGVRAVGLTWNYANWAADGVREPRQGGLTVKGKQFVRECNQLGMIVDVSHLTETGFWELCEMSRRPFYASHSNAYAICPHPRNLKNDQIEALFRQGGIMGLTFVPYFLRKGSGAAIDDVLRHVEHVCGLGGERQLTFGSDFDGINEWVRGLEHAGCYPQLIEALLRRYSETQVRGFLWENARQFFNSALPEV
ncbi:diguanylate cyclase [Xylanibacillus composti]|uniref:Diguanylate cyclase n=1 Tax=Xylanibacillus composti TaxID=1572762 RepID=A0A8J4H6W5_9BACL|nr:dipeptidase [Xylanibacillus composti]GIQ70991.1 diguanylate cyclase [Xylanibacillus composti]